MNRTNTISWIVWVCASGLRLSQAKTLAALVVGCVQVQRVSLANIGRRMIGTAKHQIKRCWRFVDNDRIEPTLAMKGVVEQLLRKRRKSKKPLLVSFDWTDIRGFQVLMAATVLKGRSVPLCWASCAGQVFDGYRSRNAFEESLLLVLRSMIPPKIRIILLADRGFGRTELARFCQNQGMGYVIRIKADVCIKAASWEGNLLDYPVYKGICKLLRNVEYRQNKPVVQNVIIRWVRGLPKDRDHCWFLMTDQQAGPAQLSRLYGRRMGIEELFRDGKNKRNGWSLRDIQLKTAARLDRLLLILALAYLLLIGLGLVALEKASPKDWCSNSQTGTCSLFVIGQNMLHKLKCSAAQVFRTFCQATEEAMPNWG